MASSGSRKFSEQQNWIEKYRAALIETDPRRQLARIAEAYEAIQELQPSRVDARLGEAIQDAKLVLVLLREGSLDRAGSAPWL